MLAASTNLTGFEKPWTPSKKLAKLSYIGNIRTYGDIPEFLGGLTNLSVLHLEDNSFNGSVPGESSCQSMQMQSRDTCERLTM